jgi:hypothetical protein
MKPDLEHHLWRERQAHAAARLSPGFADRVLRLARASVEAAPSLLGQFLLGAATAAACALVVVVVHSRLTHVQDQRTLADWQEIASSSADDLSQAQ